MAKRFSTGIYLGSSGADKVCGPDHSKAAVNPEDEAKLQRAVRAHGNFAESTPFAFFLIFLAELNGAPTSLVHAAYTTLFVARVAHANLGIQADQYGAGFGRLPGTVITLAVTVGAGLYNVSRIHPPSIYVAPRPNMADLFSPRHVSAMPQLNLGWEPLKSFLGLK